MPRIRAGRGSIADVRVEVRRSSARPPRARTGRFARGRRLLGLCRAGGLLLAVGALLAMGACGLLETGEPAALGPEDVPPLGERATFDRPDEAPGPLLHVVYAVCSDCPDREMDVRGTIDRSLEEIQAFLAARTGLALRWDVFDGAADVTFLRVGASRAELASRGLSVVGTFIEALKRAGLDEGDKKYLLVYEGHGPDTCGAARQDGPVALVFVGPNDRFCPRGFAPFGRMSPMEYNMLHELLHALGFVDRSAPNHVEDDPHHVDDDPRDIMYSGPEKWRPAAIDPGGDDYLGRAVPEGVKQLWESPYVVEAISGAASEKGRARIHMVGGNERPPLQEVPPPVARSPGAF